MYLSEQAVSPQFRAAIAAYFPALEKNAAYWKMAGYLMFAGGLESGELLIPAPLVAKIEGKTVNGKYCAWTFLAAFHRDIVRLDIRAHTTETCRVITRVHWPKDVWELLAAERRAVGGERVLFSNGVKWRSEHSGNERAALQAEAIETLQNLGHHPAYELLNLLNGAAPNRFSVVKKYLLEAHALVDSLDLIPAERERQHNILRAIERQAQPIYGPAPRSARIFAINDSITRLQRDVRKLLTQEWITCDLKSAQLSIVARLWNVPQVSMFLESGGCIWQSLCDWMGMDVKKDKQLMKDCLYALIFGAGRDSMIETIGSRKAYNRFRRHPQMRVLFLARAVQLRKIRHEKHGIDAFGRRTELEYISLPGKKFSYDTSRKILALQAQSFELLLLTPVIQMAAESKDFTRGFTLCMWLHDGFAFACSDNRDRGSWISRLSQAVKNQADSLCIQTELETQ